jgi:hypothetical protein
MLARLVWRLNALVEVFELLIDDEWDRNLLDGKFFRAVAIVANAATVDSP